MHDNHKSSSTAYFDSIASKWDSWHDLEALNVKLGCGLKKFGLKPDEHILDVGCGTGNLTSAIISLLSDTGRITAIDMSSDMLEVAKRKVNDLRVTWVCNTVENLNASEESFDRIICYSVWPHLTDAQQAGKIFQNLLRSGGILHIWHLISRDAVNKIHSTVSDAVSGHFLLPAQQTASMLAQLGYEIEEVIDEDNEYLVTACKV